MCAYAQRWLSGKSLGITEENNCMFWYVYILNKNIGTPIGVGNVRPSDILSHSLMKCDGQFIIQPPDLFRQFL